MSNDIREVFKRFRNALNEEEQGENGEWFNPHQNGVPYTQQDEILETSMESARNQFGADFSRIKTPMFYYKNDNDITFSGEIPTMKDARFQFSYKKYPNGCYFWGGKDELEITRDVALKFQRMCGVYENWKTEIDKMTDKKPISMKNDE